MKQLLLTLTLFFVAVCCFSQEQEEWDVYMAQFEKSPGTVMINMSLKGKAPIKALPYVVITGVTYKKCDASGLPEKTAFDDLYTISDSVKNLMDRIVTHKMAGTFTYQCERLDYFYITDTARIREQLTKLYTTRFPAYKYYINMRTDKAWDAYLTFLYPNEETQEYMSNQKVLAGLSKNGDKLEKARKVDHWFYCKTEADRQNLVDYAVKNKFTIEQKQQLKDKEYPYQLQISRTDKVDMDAISAITILLRKEAKKYNAVYDGWETFVVKD